MDKLILGVLLTLAVLQPEVAKHLFGMTIDALHHIVTGAIK